MPRRKAALYVHVNQHVIRRNRKTGEREPPITVRRGRRGKPQRVNLALIKGTVQIRYSPDNPLPCGAQVWLEVSADGLYGTSPPLNPKL